MTFNAATIFFQHRRRLVAQVFCTHKLNFVTSTVFEPLSCTDVEYRANAASVSKMLSNNQVVEDERLLLRFLYGAVANRFDAHFVTFVDKWWRQLHPFVGTMDPRHVSSVLFNLGKINVSSECAIRRRFKREDVRHCEKRILAFLDDSLHLSESYYLQMATNGLAALMLPLDVDYPTEELVRALMSYIVWTMSSDDQSVSSYVDSPSGRLKDCTFIAQHLTTMGIRLVDECFLTLNSSLKKQSYTFNETFDRLDPTSRCGTLANLMLAMRNFAEVCMMVQFDLDEAAPESWTSWMLDSELLMRSCFELLSDDSYKYLMHAAVKFTSTIVAVVIRYDRTRDFVYIFDVWSNLVLLLVYARNGIWITSRMAAILVDRLNVFYVKSKKMNLGYVVGEKLSNVCQILQQQQLIRQR